MKKRSFFALGLGLAVLTASAAQTSRSDAQVYVGLIVFDQNTRDLTGGKPVLLDQAGLATLTAMLDRDYVIATEAGTTLYYSVHSALKGLTDNQSSYPANTDRISVVTFTDGLDNGSTNPELQALEGQNFGGGRASAYQNYLRTDLARRQIRGKPVTAFSVGVMGNDVSDRGAFETSIRAIATPENVAGMKTAYPDTNFNEISRVFEDIAAGLYLQSREITFQVTTPTFPVGTKIRMTFDVTGRNISDAAGRNSRKYLEGEVLGFASGQYQLGNVTYNGISSTSGASLYGTLSRGVVTYTFTGFQGFEPDPRTIGDTVKQWSMTEGSTIWQFNSEYDPATQTEQLVETKSTVIWLVLDASRSMNQAGITSVRNAAKAFLNIFITGDLSSFQARSGSPVRPSPPASSPVPDSVPAPAPASRDTWKNSRFFLGMDIGFGLAIANSKTGGHYEYYSYYDPYYGYQSDYKWVEGSTVTEIPFMLAGAVQAQVQLFRFLALRAYLAGYWDFGDIGGLAVPILAELTIPLGDLVLELGGGYDPLNGPAAGFSIGLGAGSSIISLDNLVVIPAAMGNETVPFIWTCMFGVKFGFGQRVKMVK